MKTRIVIVTKAVCCQHNEAWDPAEYRNVAEDGCGAGSPVGKTGAASVPAGTACCEGGSSAGGSIRSGCTSRLRCTRLGRATASAILIAVAERIAALCAEWHSKASLPSHTLHERGRFRKGGVGSVLIVRVIGEPDPERVCTSHVERQNLTMRMQIRRLTRLTNGFSKKFENHWGMLCLYFAWYNFVRVHRTLRVTPAMEAGLTVGYVPCADSVQRAGRPVLHSEAAQPGDGDLDAQEFQEPGLKHPDDPQRQSSACQTSPCQGSGQGGGLVEGEARNGLRRRGLRSYSVRFVHTPGVRIADRFGFGGVELDMIGPSA